MTDENSWSATRIRMWELGHRFDEIDSLGVEEVGKIIGYWSGKSKGEAKLRQRQKKRQDNAKKNKRKK
jgi:hypothetical protein